MAKMIKGPALSQTDMGNPLPPGDTAFGVCIYDGAGDLAGEMIVDRPGDLCGGKPCWKSIGKDPPLDKGYKYKDRVLSSDGIQKIIYKGGDAGRSNNRSSGTLCRFADLIGVAPVALQTVNAANSSSRGRPV